MKKKIKIAMIGTGFMGQVAHLQNYLLIPECEIVAFADAREEQRKLVSKKYQINNCYINHTELIENEKELDAVVIVSPREMTGPIAFDCLNKGLHCLTEKPMCSSLEQGIKLVKIAKEKNLIYTIGNMRRHDLGIQEGKRLVDEFVISEKMGKLTYIRIHSFDSKPYCNEDNYIQTSESLPECLPKWALGPNWLPENKIKDFAFFINVFCHDINIVRYILNENNPKIGYTNLKNMNSRLSILEFSKVNVLLEAGRSSSLKRDEFCEIYFEDGKIDILFPSNLARNQPARVIVTEYGKQQKVTEHWIDWSWAFRRQAETFINDVKNNNLYPICSGEDSLHDIDICENIWKNELKIELNSMKDNK